MGDPAAAPKQPQRPTIPFRKASTVKRAMEDQKSGSAALGDSFSWELKSKGYLGRLRIIVGGTETTATADPTASADFPWNMAKRIEVRDSSAGMLHSTIGYNNYAAEQWMTPYIGRALASVSDTRLYAAAISAVQANNLRWSWEVPIESGTKDNLGLVPNQNAGFKYTLTMDLSPQADLVTTPANTTWAATFRPSMRYYTVPSKQRTDGAAQQDRPPFAGIIRQVSDQRLAIASTGSDIPIDLRRGKVIRQLIFITRQAAASPAGANFPRAGGITQLKIKYGDDIVLMDALEQDLLDEAYNLYGIVPPTGVYPVTFAADADTVVGSDFRRDLLDVREIAHLWIEGNFQTNSAKLDVVYDELIVPRGVSI
ncbi:MAG TPA: hypothetical protein VGS18_01480 [Thermoplasmata archaeon]|nr:hypothetical protein [Thermoplasmata archaeon]